QHVQREQLCLGMDVTLALHWESLINNSCRHSSSSREFEFDMGSAPEAAAEGGDEDGISPADELFYKGQLLPLHLRPRLQMVEKLSFENQQEKEADNDDDDEEEIAPSSSAAAAVIQGMMMVRNSADEEERREACNVEEAPEFRHSQATPDSSETAEVELCSAAGDGREERLSKSRDRWTKYIKMLKPLSVKMMDNAPPRTSSSSLEAPGAISSSRKSGRLSFVKPAAEKKSAVAPRRKSLSGSLIFPSMSQTSTTRMAAIGWAAPRRSDGSDSSNNCGLLRQISHSTISDLQSSLQGAIAHCKQSHASASAHATTTRSSFVLRNNLLAP
ncbi:unnamed protein product, partial [Sphagnum jensenii]